MGKSVLKTYLAANDITVKELHALLNGRVSYNNLSRIINGQKCTISTAEEIARVLRASVWDLFPGQFKYEGFFKRRTR